MTDAEAHDAYFSGWQTYIYTVYDKNIVILVTRLEKDLSVYPQFSLSVICFWSGFVFVGGKIRCGFRGIGRSTDR